LRNTIRGGIIIARRLTVHPRFHQGMELLITQFDGKVIESAGMRK
jgi:hypothetical protein